MADANMPDQSVLAGLGTPAGITSLLNIFKGSSSTQTQTTNVSLAAQQALLQQDLIGNNGVPGLASLAMGQKSAGMYNSTVNQLLTNSLLAKSAADVAALSSSKTTTNTVNPQLGGGSAGKTALGVIGTAIAGNLINKAVGGAIGAAGSSMMSALGLGGTAIAGDKLLSMAGATPEALAAGASAANGDVGTKMQANTDALLAKDGSQADSNDPNSSIDNAMALEDQKKKYGNTNMDENYISSANSGDTGNPPGNVVTPIMDSIAAPATDSAAVMNVVNSSASDLAVGSSGLDTTTNTTDATGYGPGGKYTADQWNSFSPSYQAQITDNYNNPGVSSTQTMNAGTMAPADQPITQNTGATPGSTGNLTNPYTNNNPLLNGSVNGSSTNPNNTNNNQVDVGGIVNGAGGNTGGGNTGVASDASN